MVEAFAKIVNFFTRGTVVGWVVIELVGIFGPFSLG